ncbi:hypothetical protein Pmani_026073 [Petrolisthes manimaculis]|uniref:Trimethyllysine dioxygenase, mitochondrial n=1 Tax=Petrolisthes manimaculis TaxID=1843537 RepID=A0AAE1TY73_9EUCA|nr:hypothetical protein Pmani_026073 [Petrolisthes manimaculis]
MLQTKVFQFCRSLYRVRCEVSRRWSSQHHLLGAKTVDTGGCLEVQHPHWPHSLRVTYPWLRDHCRCDQCFNHVTVQRKFDLSALKLNIRPATVISIPEELEVTWPDGHKSKYDYQFLWQNTFEGCQTSYKSPRLLWTPSTFPEPDLTTVPLSALESSDKKGIQKLLYSILRHGFGFISEVPPDLESTRSAVENVCAVQKSFYGEMWELQGTNLTHYDTAYTSEYIGPHTDQTYFSIAARIQVFHCLQPALEGGGETLLIDGFSVAQKYKEKYPQGYDYLSSTAFPAQYKEEGQQHASLDTIFKHNPVTGNLQQFRFNVYDRAPLSSIPLEKMQDFYLHFSNLVKTVQNPRNEHWLQLQPGMVVLIDNWRIMHGRNKFSGMRRMCGCYFDNDDFSSAARVLGIQLE